MFSFQISLLLTVSSLTSLLLAAHDYRHHTDGPINLEISDSGLKDENLDILEPEDFIDGYPVSQGAFWANMRVRKTIILFTYVMTFALQMAPLYVDAGQISAEDAKFVIAQGLYSSSSLYIALVAAVSFNQEGLIHSRAIIHLSVLTVLPIFLTISVFVATARGITPEWQYSTPLLVASKYLVFGLQTSGCLIAITTPRGPPLYFPQNTIYTSNTVPANNAVKSSVSGSNVASIFGSLFFSYITNVFMLGTSPVAIEISDLPILPADMRAAMNFIMLKKALNKATLRFPASPGLKLAFCLVQANWQVFLEIQILATIVVPIYYGPAFFIRKLLAHLEAHKEKEDLPLGLILALGLFFANALLAVVSSQLWSLASSTVRVRLIIQMNTLLYAKTLKRKDVVSSRSLDSTVLPNSGQGGFSSKSEVMTLMTTDVSRVSSLSRYMFSLTSSVFELLVGSYFLYSLLGISCFIGLGVVLMCLPVNHLAGKKLLVAQRQLMQARDERTSLTNEILGAIRMLKFMTWERSFESKLLKVREKELLHQMRSFSVEALWNSLGKAIPLVFALVSFWHFTVIRHEQLVPSIAFTAIVVFTEIQYAINQLPELLTSGLQSFVSLGRIEQYLGCAEVAPRPVDRSSNIIALRSAFVTWPQEQHNAIDSPPRFVLENITLDFPLGELSLICGKFGSGKTLLLLALLREADILSGDIISPLSPLDFVTSSDKSVPSEEWVVPRISAYVPQTAWLRNQSIKDNILFNLPFHADRYEKTLEACALLPDLAILEHGDESEIGEHGINLSGGQKARVSLARAVYSRASVLLLDDVLSAVDVHTAQHIYSNCLKGDLMRKRTVIMISHHVDLCGPGAKYVVSLDNGTVKYAGGWKSFYATLNVPHGLSENLGIEASLIDHTTDKKVTGSLQQELALDPPKGISVNQPKGLGEAERRATGHIHKDVWMTYFRACGATPFWVIFILALVLGAMGPVLENGWLKNWSASYSNDAPKGPIYYLGIYAIIIITDILIQTGRWFILYAGSIQASNILYGKLLNAVLFATIRFHDTVSRGRILNRFGKDFEAIDSQIAGDLGRSMIIFLSLAVTFATITIIGGPLFALVAVALGFISYKISRVYGQTARELRRLTSVTSSLLYAIYGETISGLDVIRAFGASTFFLLEMMRRVNTNMNPYYWSNGLNRWLSIRFAMFTGMFSGLVAVAVLLVPRVDASLAGFALTFASTLSLDLLYLVRRFVDVEQNLVAVERIKEYSEVPREGAEYISPRPPASWPSFGSISCQNLVVQYADGLPDVLRGLTFNIRAGEKIGVLGRTGSGKTTLALALFRFLEAKEGNVLIDGINIANIGLTDLRRGLTIIPQDPTIMSGTLHSALDVFEEYDDAEIFESLRRVHLLGSESDRSQERHDTDVFRNLDLHVSEFGKNFSTGERQLLCMARALLKRSKILVMDEATASVDNATDELITRTIREEFAESTIITIAHRLRTVANCDRVMVLDNGIIVEFDRPLSLLRDRSSKFYGFCQAAGKDEFDSLVRMIGNQEELGSELEYN
ncbi:multidrug resistance-associated ABC transporter [Collybia nuda]|uniref:Multidrug resistance-associated ABC transporter n=1 Tax=Collybia nuda TaxID=64659 RepID=A0A9P5Y2B7_9AGAR|nr:multidrug resistance-associated ABC transporter [Collybia nuda]